MSAFAKKCFAHPLSPLCKRNEKSGGGVKRAALGI